MKTFEAYSWQHWGALIAAVLIGVLLVRYGRKQNDSAQWQIGLIASLVVVGSIFIGDIILLARGIYDVKLDLPLFLCRVVAWLMPFAIAFRWKKALGVFYFWTLAGTLQALFTPDLQEGFPGYFYFRYWILHAGLVITSLYAVIVFRLQIGWKDFWRAVAWAQVYLVVIYSINLVLDSNYSYLMRKPPESILDLMGPWPWYILAGEGLMIILFLLCILPFLIGRQKAS